MSVVAPSLSSFFRGRTLDCEARRLLALTRHGHERAIADGFPVVLWIDSARQAYGLQAENGFEEQDSKALRMDLDKDLRIEVTETTATVARQLNGSLGNLPAIRFLPDGSVDEASPTEIRLQDRTGMMVVRQIRPPSRSDSRIRSSPNAIYEIQRQNTIWSR
jgi:hypothetical protein